MKNRQSIIWILIILGMLIGGVLATVLMGRETGEYAFDLIIPIVTGGIIAMVVNRLFATRKSKRNGNVPEIDERTIKNLQKYFMHVLYYILFGSGAALVIAYAMGIETIETGLLLVCLLGVFIISAAGAVVVKRI